MSRIAELRAKLSSKEIDWDLVDFSADLDEVAQKAFSASTIGKDEFIKKIYDKFLIDQPKNKKKWMKEQLTGCFACINKPPKWVKEPHWLYYNDEPMIFVNQFLGNGEKMFYVFMAYIEIEDATTKIIEKTAIYRMTAQYDNYTIHLKGEIKT